MPDELDESVAGVLDQLGDLDEHLARARQAVAQSLPENERPRPFQALDAAHAAVSAFGAFAGGLHRDLAGGASIHLARRGHEVVALVLGEAAPEEIAAFITELRRIDERFLESAELLGLLVGLCARWVSASFAPPAVLHSLAESAPRILALGAALAEDAGRSDAGDA